MQNPNLNNNKVHFITVVPTPHEYKANSDFQWTHVQLLQNRLSSNLTLKEYTPSQKDKLFFYPGCDVPRYKVRNWVESIKGSVTIKPENATAKFASKNSIDACMKTTVAVRADRQAFMKWLWLNYPMDRSVAKLYNELHNSNENFVYLDRQNNWAIVTGYHPNSYARSYAAGYQKTLHELSGGAIDHWLQILMIDPQKENALNDMLTNSNIYSQESLIKLINSNSATIDSEMYDTLVNMLRSTNREDKVTAMSVMASSDLEKSLHYILLLLQEFGKDLLDMRERNHVNFKSMLEYIGVERWWNLNVEKQMEVLMDKKVLTFDMLKEFAEGVKEAWTRDTKNKYFTIKTIEATDVVKQYFKQQATQQN